jgi:hypothetical protein
LQYQKEAFLELKHFEDPLKNVLSEEEELAQNLGINYDTSKKYAEDTMGEYLKNCDSVCEKIIYKSIYSNWLN